MLYKQFPYVKGVPFSRTLPPDNISQYTLSLFTSDIFIHNWLTLSSNPKAYSSVGDGSLIDGAVAGKTYVVSAFPPNSYVS